MTELEFREALRRSLSGADLPDCRRRQLLAQLKGEAPMKTRSKLRMTLIAALLLALTATVAMAATGMFHGTVGWDGQPQEEEEVIQTNAVLTTDHPVSLPSVTPTPDTHPVLSPLDMARILHEEAVRAEGDLIVVSEAYPDPAGTITGRRTTTQRSIALPDASALRERLAGSPLPLPALPEGYSIAEARVIYDCGAQGEYTPVDAWVREGAIVTRYHASEAHDLVSGYVLILTDGSGAELTIQAGLQHNSSDMGFGLWDSDEARAVTIPGMNEALLLVRSHQRELFIRSALAEPIPVIARLHPDADTDDRIEQLEELFIRVTATALEEEALLALFAP